MPRSRSRKRRAAPKDIYPACKISNTCPPDIVNKIEHTTIADRILQYGSLGVFFGGLGIGTGSGGGGRTGYVPIGEGPGVRVGGPRVAVRPSIPVDTVGPSDLFPVDTVNPMGPSIIPLQELPPNADVTPSLIEVIAEVHPVSDTPPTQTPSINTTDSSAVLQVGTDQGRVVSRTQYNNPSFDVAIITNAQSGEISASDHIFVNGHGGGQSIGADSIPLRGFGVRSSEVEGVTETSFYTSTPTSRPVARPRSLYGPRIEQQIVEDVSFITRPSSFVTFDNPVYDASVSLTFEQDLAELAAAAPRVEFSDIVRLGRPQFSQGPDGRLRLGRLGQKANIKLRSGLKIGPRSHYYYEFSTIGSETESGVVGEQSTASTLVSGQAEGIQYDAFEEIELFELSEQPLIPDDELLDTGFLEAVQSFADDLQLVFGSRAGRSRSVNLPNFPHIRRAGGPVFAYDNDVFVYTPESSGNLQSDAREPDNMIPWIIIGTQGSDYDLHPSLLRRRRKLSFL
ncbi:L2 [Castor canadensis papillomavirus 1]|uniref:Minor capsid protein L2 n=1 Tax=Castor canadensis papillomavirus 1 TaxID=1352235 RepID=V9P889_9PAPI|nr:L2 [Castor canadensis papillomavirus 1]AGV05017.1 L2 [Castor canadensis papillomavirus 1]